MTLSYGGPSDCPQPTSSAKRSGAEESSGAANSAKKLRQTKTTVTVPNLEEGVLSAAILGPDKIKQVAPDPVQDS